MSEKLDLINLSETKAKFIHSTSFWIAIIIIIASLLRIIITKFEIKRILASFVAAAIMLTISYFVKKTGYKKKYAYIMLVGFMIVIINGAYQNGSFQAPVVAGMFIIPLFGSLLLEDEGLKLGIAINIFLIVLLAVFMHFNISMPFNDKNSNLFFPIVYLSTNLITYSILTAYLGIKKRSDSMIVKMYNEIILKAQISSLIGLSEGMSHEINNPLTIISVKNQKAIDQLKRKENITIEEREQLLQHLEKVQESTKRITKIVTALFQFSHHSEAEDYNQYDLAEILNYSLETVIFRGAAKNIQFKIECPKTLLLRTRKAQLAQVLINLLNNAIDAIEANEVNEKSNDLIEKWIEVKVIESTRTKIHLSITDSGKGIPKELQDKILLPFFTTKEVGKGSGMGLSLSLGIIQSMSGDLWLDKTSARTKFILEIPR